MTELVERLRAIDEASMYDEPATTFKTVQEAAAEIERLTTRVAEMEVALKPFADCVDQISDDEDDEEWAKFRLLISDYRRARRAL